VTAPGTTSGQPVNHTPTQTHTPQHAPPAGLHAATVKQRHPRRPHIVRHPRCPHIVRHPRSGPYRHTTPATMGNRRLFDAFNADVRGMFPCGDPDRSCRLDG